MTVHNAKLHPGYVNSNFRFKPDFPLFFTLLGKRDDEPVRFFHMHNALEIGYCREGAGTFSIGGKVLPFQQGDITVITPLEWHRSRSAPGTCSLWTWFFFDPARLLVPAVAQELPYAPARYAGDDFRNVLTAGDYPELTVLFQELIYEAERQGDGWRESLRGLLLLFLQRLSRRNPGATGAGGAGGATGDVDRASPCRLLPALNAIAHEYAGEWRVEDLAALCHMSLRNFQIQFRKSMGQTPQTYLIRCRVQAAVALLRATAQPVTQIAFACGFGSLSSFNRAFQCLTGTSPRAFRHSARPRA